MVRPERFELPTYWFVASRSIQLSYGRTREVSSETIVRISGFRGQRNYRISGSRRILLSRLRGNRGQFCIDIQACLSHQLRHGRGVQPGGVIFYLQSVRGAVDCEAVNAVDLANVSQRASHRLDIRGRDGIAKVNFHRGHKGMIARREP